LEAEVARLTAEVERMQCVSNVACSSNGHYQRVNDNLRQQLAVTTERLAAASRPCVAEKLEKAAERISEILYPEIPGITDSDGVMFARESVRDNVLGILNDLAQGWLPADGAKGETQ
jgi:hypothetical protein